MSQSMPMSGFKWIPVENIDVTTMDDNAENGLILEVDLH